MLAAKLVWSLKPLNMTGLLLVTASQTLGLTGIAEAADEPPVRFIRQLQEADERTRKGAPPRERLLRLADR
jgi:hypothetical protein